MGYEDRLVDVLKRNYHNVRRSKSRISRKNRNYGSSNFPSDLNQYTNGSTNTKKLKKPRKKYRCKKNFKFSKYHWMSKRGLYEYQMEECRQGLKGDALSQIKYIHDLIEKDESLRIIKCKIEEIEEFIKYHQLSDNHIQQKMNELKKYFKNNSYKG